MSLRVLGVSAMRCVAARSISTSKTLVPCRVPKLQDVLDLVQKEQPNVKEKGVVAWYLRKSDPDEAVDVWENTALHVVRSAAIARLLIEAKANLNAMNGMGRTVLEEQVKRGNFEVVLELKFGRANVKLGSPIFDAVKNNDVGMVAALTEWDVDVHVRDESGATPLHYARKWEIACMLLNCGVDHSVKNKAGDTALMSCLKRYQDSDDCNDLLLHLLVKGANPNVADALGRTPLFYTVKGGFCFHRGAARKLLEWGANGEHKDLKGKIALYHAAELGNREAVAFFLDWREKKALISAVAPHDDLSPRRRFRKMGQS